MLRCSLELSEALLITHQISTAKREGCSCVCSFSTLLFFDGFIWEKEIVPKGYKQ